jgi:hypothetical protein
MVNTELTGNRPNNYSLWHRTLKSNMFMTDGDWFEQRVKDGKLVSVAYIETIQLSNLDAYKSYPVWRSKKELCNEITTKMQIPSFVVYHDTDCKNFVIINVVTGQIAKFDEDRYKDFLKGLGT